MEVALLVTAGVGVTRGLFFLFAASAMLNAGVVVTVLVARGLLLLLAVTAVVSALAMSGKVLAVWANAITGYIRMGGSQNVVTLLTARPRRERGSQ